MTKLRWIIGLALLIGGPSFAHYYFSRAITNPVPVVGTPILGAPTTSTQWACVRADGTVNGALGATQASIETACGTLVSQDGITRYLEERVTVSRATTTTTSTRRVEVLGGTTIRVSDAHAQILLGRVGGGGVVADGTPSSFSFTDQTNVSLSSTITSAGVTISGIDTTISCGATGGTVDVGADANFQSSRNVTNNQSIRARHTSSASNSTATNTVVDCGGVSDTFTSTTLAASGNRLVGDEYFSSDMDASGDGPTFGFDGYDGEANCANESTRTWNATGGPANRPYINYEINTALTEYGCSYRWSIPRAQISNGDTIFIRFSLYLTDDSQEQKFIIIDPTGSSARPILTIEDWSPTNSFSFRWQKDGGDDLIQYPSTGSNGLTSFGQWHNVQLRLVHSSTNVATDGGYAIWFNNDTLGSPNVTTSGILVPADDGATNSYITFAGYHQGSLSGNQRTFRIADIRIGPTFDSSWNSSGTAVIEPTHFLDTFDAELDAANDERWELAA